MTAPYWASDDEDVVLHLGDCLDVLRTMEADSVDAIVTDPPAGIAFMGRDWDDFCRARSRFVDMLTERMAEAYRVLKPGGHALVWAIPRTSHWTAWAIEDAGFDLRDCVLHLFGSGFPKSLDVSKAIDRMAVAAPLWDEIRAHLRYWRDQRGLTNAQLNAAVGGAVNGGGRASAWLSEDQRRPELPSKAQWVRLREVLRWDQTRLDDVYGAVKDGADRPVLEERATTRRGGNWADQENSGMFRKGDVTFALTAPATEDATRWEGWGTALKPGQEMWWLARKPLKGTTAGNVLEFGTGALNIDGCKVGTEQRVNNAGGMGSLQNVSRVEHGYRQHVVMPSGEPSEVTGRWPTNIVFTHSAACEPLGVREVRSDGHHPATRGAGGLGTSGHSGQDGLAERKSGTEATTAWACAPDCPVGELDRQSGVSTSTGGNGKGYAPGLNGVYGDFGQQTLRANAGGLGDTGGASRFYPTFRYQAKAPASERPRLDDGTAHETVKSLGLMSWLVRLITPPGGTVLDMFAGSGPVGEVCVIEGFRCVLIEQNPKSAELIKTRLAKPIQPAMFGLEAS